MVAASIERLNGHIKKTKKKMQQNQHYVNRRRSGTYDDFYTKLERIRLSAASSKLPIAEQKLFFFV